MDKTSRIRSELKKMVENGEINQNNEEKIREIIEDLTYSNIYKYERAETLQLYPVEILEILGEARQRYLSNRKVMKPLSDSIFRIESDQTMDFDEIRERTQELAANEIVKKGQAE